MESSSNARSISLALYYRSFRSVCGALVGLISASPVLSKLFLPETLKAYGFPPLGDAEGPARIATFVFALFVTYFAFFSGAPLPTGNRRRIRVVAGFALVFLFSYVALSMRLVRTVEVPSTGTAIQVSVGFERTDFARSNFPGESDWDLLRERGPYEEEIWRLWTSKSLIISRLSLYAAYCLLVLSIVTSFSWGVLYHLQKETGIPKTR